MQVLSLPLLSTFLLFPTISPAQQYTFHTYTGEDGLSQMEIETIFQDHDGFLRFGTQAGLNRYDGTTFEVFGIRNNLVSDFFV